MNHVQSLINIMILYGKLINIHMCVRVKLNLSLCGCISSLNAFPCPEVQSNSYWVCNIVLTRLETYEEEQQNRDNRNQMELKNCPKSSSLLILWFDKYHYFYQEVAQWYFSKQGSHKPSLGVLCMFNYALEQMVLLLYLQYFLVKGVENM